MQRGQCATWRDLKDRAITHGSALDRCPVEVPIGGLDQRPHGRFAVRVGEAEKRGESRRDVGGGIGLCRALRA